LITGRPSFYRRRERGAGNHEHQDDKFKSPGAAEQEVMVSADGLNLSPSKKKLLWQRDLEGMAYSL
jgi:hypothetical protein